MRRPRKYLVGVLLLIFLVPSGGCLDLVVDSIKNGLSEAISDAVSGAATQVLANSDVNR